MGPPAARIGDMHTCPMVTPGTPPVPHVGGPLLPPGVVTVLICKLPAVNAPGNMATCVGPPDSTAKGSATVLTQKRMQVRIGDLTVHGGSIVAGAPTVLVGG